MESDRFIVNLHEYCLVKPGDLLLVGVSGGADSICLLDNLQKAGIKLIVANYNHRLRPEADSDSEFVKQVANARGLEFIQGSGDVAQFAKQAHKTIEEAARICRYGFLFEQAVKRKATAVAVGHTADDQVETILMHLLRGCGLEGLQGMQPCIKTDFNQDIYLVRPLLFMWREEVINYCHKNTLSYVEDSSNSNTRYFRNQIRKELIPNLQKYNPNIKKHFINLGKIVTGDLEHFLQESRENFNACLLNENRNFIQLSLNEVLKYSISQERRVIQIALKELLPLGYETNFEQIEEVINFIQHPNQGKHLELVSHLEISIEGNCLYFHKKGAQLPDYSWPMIDREFHFNVNEPGELKISTKWVIKTEFVPMANIKLPNYSGQLLNVAFIDADKVNNDLLVRTQKPGDRYASLGLMGKSQKLSDFWINNKVPKRFRLTWPLILCEDQIIWIPGFQPSHDQRITDETKKVIKIEMIKLKE